MTEFLLGIAVAGIVFVCWPRSKSRKGKAAQPFMVPTVVAEIHREITMPTPESLFLRSYQLEEDYIERWLSRSSRRREDLHRYRDAKQRFLYAIRRREVPPEWTQEVLGGLILEYAAGSEVVGLAAGARALGYAEIARWMKKRIQEQHLPH